jgi:hypothetical protein
MYPSTIEKKLKVLDIIPIFYNSLKSILGISMVNHSRAVCISIYHARIMQTLLKRLLIFLSDHKISSLLGEMPLNE